MGPKDVIRAAVEAYNAKSLERAVALYHDDATFWDPFHREGVQGADGIGELVQGLFAAFPDERMEIVTLAADDQNVVAEFHSTGTNPKTGQPFELEFTEVYVVRDGRIASCRVYIDPEALPE